MKRFYTISILLLFMACMVQAQLTAVYVNPVDGLDANSGSVAITPVQTWGKAISLAASGATIYVTGGPMAVTGTVNGAQYGASNITVTPNTAYTGALFAINGGSTATFTNLTIQGTGTAQNLVSVNSGCGMTIGTGFSITNNGRVSLDKESNGITMTAAPAAGTVPIVTEYKAEGQAIVTTAIANAINYFTLAIPVATSTADYKLVYSGTNLVLSELPIGDIYLDPLTGDDTKSGASYAGRVKTLDKALSIWNARNAETPGIDTAIIVCNQINLDSDISLSGGLMFKRHSSFTSAYMFYSSGYDITLDNVTIKSGYSSAIYIYGGDVTVEGGSEFHISGGYGIRHTNGHITIGGNSTFYVFGGTGVYSEGTSSTSRVYIDINDATFNVSGYGYGIQTGYYANLSLNSGATFNSSSYYPVLYIGYYNITNIYSGAYIESTYSGTSSNNIIQVYNYGTFTMTGGTLKNSGDAPNRKLLYLNSITNSISGGTMDGGNATALYLPSSSSSYTTSLSNCTITSTNTTNGTIMIGSRVNMDGTNTTVSGPINMTNVDTYPLYITSSTVTKDYTIMVSNFLSGGYPSNYYATVVTSDPKIDLGLHYPSRFTYLSTMSEFDLIAYARKGGAQKDLVLYYKDGVYVNDYTGNDLINTGASPASPLKTLTKAITMTSTAKNKIFICDSTYTVTDAQNLSPATARDTIIPLLFPTSRPSMINVVGTGGSLTLENIALWQYSYNNTINKGIGSLINITGGGNVVLNSGASLLIYYNCTGIYMNTSTGGNLVMNGGSKISYLTMSRTTGTNDYGSTSGYGINITAPNYTATLNTGSVIEKVGYGIGCNYGTVNIDGATIRKNYSNNIYISGTGVANMTDGEITESYYNGISIGGGTFNMSGGQVYNNCIYTSFYTKTSGENVLSSNGKFNFTGGKMNPKSADRTVLSINGSYATDNVKMYLNNSAAIDSGYIYLNTPYSGLIPIELTEQLSAGKIFNFNMPESMAGQTVVDGTTQSKPASVSNFALHPELAATSLALQQDGDNVVVGTGDIYLNGSAGIDTNDGLTPATAVRTFKRAREVLYANSSKSVIKITGYANLGNAGEISDWDLSQRRDAKLQRATGYTSYLVYVPGGKTFTLKDIHIEGTDALGYKGDYITRGIIFTQVTSSNPATIKIEGGTLLDSSYCAIYGNNYTTVNMSGGEIRGNSYGICYSSVNLSDSALITENVYGTSYVRGNFTMRDTAAVTNNNYTGIDIQGLSDYESVVDITGGTVSGNRTGLIITQYTRSAKLSGCKILNNSTTGISMSSASTAPVTLKITDVEISGNSNGCQTTGGIDSILISGCEIVDNAYTGINVQGNTQQRQGVLEISDCKISRNKRQGISLSNCYYRTEIKGNTEISYNKTSSSGGGIYNSSNLPVTLSGNVSIVGNTATLYGGGIYNDTKGIMSVSDGVYFSEDTCGNQGGAIYNAGISLTLENTDIDKCVNVNSSTCYGSAIYSESSMTMTGGSISECSFTGTSGYGTVYINGGENTFTGATFENNTAPDGSAIYCNGNSAVLILDSDTIRDNTTTRLTSHTSPVSGAIFYNNGTIKLRDRCLIDDEIFLNSTNMKIVVDEALMSGSIASNKLLIRNPAAGRVVATPNGSTVSDASQYITKFAYMNEGSALGLDKGGTGGTEIILVNQFFIDGTKPDGGNGSTPNQAFNEIADLTSLTLNRPYTTVWVSGPVTISGNETIIPVTNPNISLRRYNGFMVNAQLYPAYKGVLFTVNDGATLNIPGGNSAANQLTIAGYHGAMTESDAALIKNNGTLNLSGYILFDDNPTQGVDAIVQNGTMNLHGNVDFSTDGSNTVYLAAGKVINIDGALSSSITPIGITVDGSTNVAGRIIATGTTANVPSGTEARFVNQMTGNPKYPIGRYASGGTANLMFYVADRAVAETPAYASVQEAIDESNSGDVVRLYVDTDESATLGKTIGYKSQGNRIGTMTLDSTAVMTMGDHFHADSLFIRANTFGKKAQLYRGGYGMSIYAAAYLDLTVPSGATMGYWYPVNLPFDASINDVADTQMNALAYMDKFAIAEYSGQRRASYGVGNYSPDPNNDWGYLSGTDMHNGTGYMVSVDGVNTLRFKKSPTSDMFKSPGDRIVNYTGAAASTNHGINYLSQPIGSNATVASGISNGSIIQASDDYSSELIGAASYVARTVGAATIIAPYTNYFYISGTNDSVKYTESTNAATIRSGSVDTHTSEVPDYFELRIYSDNAEHYDAFFAAASEYASEDEYEIGRDVLKIGGTNAKLAQLWSVGFNTLLCAEETVLRDGVGKIPLYVNTPEAKKEYHLTLASQPYNGMQLWLCDDGKPVQNLSEYPDYTIEGTGGTTDRYSLRLLSSPTANEVSGKVYVYGSDGKIVISGIEDGDDYSIYNMSGQLLAHDTAHNTKVSIYVGRGIYVVRVNGIDYKAVVK